MKVIFILGCSSDLSRVGVRALLNDGSRVEIMLWFIPENLLSLRPFFEYGFMLSGILGEIIIRFIAMNVWSGGLSLEA